MTVTVGGTDVGVARLAAGSGVTSISVSGAPQENKIKGMVKANRQSLKVVLIYAFPTSSLDRSDTLTLIIRLNVKYHLNIVLIHQRGRTE